MINLSDKIGLSRSIYYFLTTPEAQPVDHKLVPVDSNFTLNLLIFSLNSMIFAKDYNA